MEQLLGKRENHLGHDPQVTSQITSELTTKMFCGRGICCTCL